MLLRVSHTIGLIAIRLATATLRRPREGEPKIDVELDLGSVTFYLSFLLDWIFFLFSLFFFFSLFEQSPVQLCKFKLMHLGAGIQHIQQYCVDDEFHFPSLFLFLSFFFYFHFIFIWYCYAWDNGVWAVWKCVEFLRWLRLIHSISIISLSVSLSLSLNSLAICSRVYG